MDQLMEDPSFAKKMVKLLGDELEELREQIRERDRTPSEGPSAGNGRLREKISQLKLENGSLKREVESLRNENAQMQDVLNSQLHEDGKSLSLQYKVSHDKAVEQLCQAIEEKEQLIRDKSVNEEVRSELEAKLASLRTKYKRVKGEVKELQAALEVLHADLTHATANVEELEVHRRGAEQKLLDMECYSTAGRPIQAEEMKAFLESDEGYLTSESNIEVDGVFPASPWFKDLQTGLFPSSLGGLCKSGAPVIWDFEDMVCHDLNRPNCFIYLPSLYWDPLKARSDSGGWDARSLSLEIDKTRELFVKYLGKFIYLGTYKCIGVRSITLNEFQKIDGQKSGRVVRRAIMSPELVPPLMHQVTKGLFAEGALAVTCYALRRIGVNGKLKNAWLHLISNTQKKRSGPDIDSQLPRKRTVKH